MRASRTTRGYAAGDGSGRRYKLFTYAPLRAPKSRRRLDNARCQIVFAPGPVSFQLASPVDEFIRNGLIAKYRTLHKKDPNDTRFQMLFDPDYLSRHKGGTKLTHYKEIKMLAILAPFTAKGSVELMEIAWNAGMGSKTGIGHGMVEVVG